jgi:peptidoglycan hydrolase-like protein with peptidoglycan-binding domain
VTTSAEPSGEATASDKRPTTGPRCGCETEPPTAPAKDSKDAGDKQRAAQSSSNDKSNSNSETADGKAAKPKRVRAGKTVYAIGSSGKDVRRLQARLKQIGWFNVDLTDTYGPKTTAAVKGFQRKHNLTITGTVDESTWHKITAMTHQPSDADLRNAEPAGRPILERGQTSGTVKELQARLTQIDWYSEKITGYYGTVTTQAVKGFQDKHGLEATGAVDQKTWDAIVHMTKKPTASELSGADSTGGSAGNTAGLDKRCLSGRAMCIDKTTRQLVWVIDGKPQLRFDVRFGADTSPTREGSFSLGWKAEDWTSTLYHSKMPYSMFFSGGQAVHYSSDFAARGYYGASHGCVNVRDLAGIKSLFSQAKVGDKVIVYRS